MANNITLNNGTGGATLATDQNGVAEHYQRIKIQDGTAGAYANTAAVTAANALKVDASAAVVNVSDNGANLHVQGAAASATAKVGNPVQTGAVFNTTQPTVTTGQVVEAQATARGALIVATGADPLTITPSGTQTVTGTVTSNIGTTNGLALDATLTGGTARTKLTDGTNNAAVKAASTAAAATDPALVVAVSPNNSVAVTGTFWQATQPVSGTVTAGQGTAAALASAWPVKVTDGTNVQPAGDANARPIHVEVDAQVGSGYTPGTLVAAATNNLTTVKASAGTLGYLSASNNAAYPLYVKAFDGSPTMGTTAAIAQWEIPANATAANGSGREMHLPPQGLKFATGIYLAVTKGQALTDNTATAASDGTVTWGYV